MTDTQVKARFYDKVLFDDGCWTWTAAKNNDGYGQIKVKGIVIKAHRLSYEMHNGPVPEDMMVLHKCDVRECVAPEHLFLGKAKDNNEDRDAKSRNYWSNRTHCKNGHEYNDENTEWRNGSRRCRPCLRKASLAHYHKNRGVEND